MDDSVADYTYSLNEAILHLDLTNKKDVKLTLDQYSFNDENDAIPIKLYRIIIKVMELH